MKTCGDRARNNVPANNRIQVFVMEILFILNKEFVGGTVDGLSTRTLIQYKNILIETLVVENKSNQYFTMNDNNQCIDFIKFGSRSSEISLY